MLKITVIDQRDPNAPKTTYHDVAITRDLKKSFEFKSPDFPIPALGRKFFVGGREIDVRELSMKVEDNKAMFYYSATFLPQP